MSSQPTKNEDSAQDAPPQTAAEVVNLVAPAIEISAPETREIATTPDEDPEKHVGRPFGYTDELAEQILDVVCEGGSLASCDNINGMPATRTIARWRRRIPTFDKAVKAAVEFSVFSFEDRAIAQIFVGTDELTEANVVVERFRHERAKDRRVALLEHADRRKEALASMQGADKPGDDPKLINGEYEVVEADTERFIEAIDGDPHLIAFQKLTGIRSKVLDEKPPAAAQ